MNKLKAIIVDDEELARDIVREYLEDHRDIEIIAECANGFEAVKSITELKPDLIFLDIQMPKISGFEVLELLPDLPAVIFITAYDQYALKAFEVHAVDYLLKPFSKERFEESLKRARSNIIRDRKKEIKPLLEEAHTKQRPVERILVKDGANVHVIQVDNIDYIEAKDDYISINAKGKSFLKHYRLSTLEKELDPSQFVRTHRSYIVNIDRISKIELYAKDSRIAILKDETRVPISRANYDKIKELL
jgi:two-component system, LytTR family, response regulator